MDYSEYQRDSTQARNEASADAQEESYIRPEEHCYPSDNRGTVACDQVGSSGGLIDPGYYWIFWAVAILLVYAGIGWVWEKWQEKRKKR